jgi:hypothetical protein
MASTTATNAFAHSDSKRAGGAENGFGDVSKGQTSGAARQRGCISVTIYRP